MAERELHKRHHHGQHAGNRDTSPDSGSDRSASSGKHRRLAAAMLAAERSDDDGDNDLNALVQKPRGGVDYDGVQLLAGSGAASASDVGVGIGMQDESGGGLSDASTGSGRRARKLLQQQQQLQMQQAALARRRGPWAMFLLIVLAFTVLAVAVVLFIESAGGSSGGAGSGTDALEVPHQTLRRVKDPAANLPTCGSGSASDSKYILLVGATVYAPHALGVRDVLLSSREFGGKIVAIEPTGSDVLAPWFSMPQGMVRVIDAAGKVIVPGLVDIHVHLTGGGGEVGPASRTPEAVLSEMLAGGLTTVVGVLGTDSISRTPRDLLTKVRAVNTLPMTAYMYTGGYQSVPVPTITGTVMQDVALIDPVVGVGEVAISDHRGSQPSPNVLRTLAADCRVGSLLAGGKAGVLYAHVGAGPGKLDPLWDIVRNTPIPITNLLPTHVSRTPELAAAGLDWIAAGGNVDMNPNGHVVGYLKDYAARNASVLHHVSVSSDCYGSLPHFDSEGTLVSYSYAKPDGLMRLLKTLVLDEGWPLSMALPLITSNPALFLQLHDKGELHVGGDADLLVLDATTLDLQHVVARGVHALSPGCVMRGWFEHAPAAH